MGPLLFVIYVNDLPAVVDVDTTVQLYADDSKCYRLISKPADQMQLQNDLNNLCAWGVDNSMRFNIKKCKHLCITKKKNPLAASYTINGVNVSRATCEKDLGSLYPVICHGTVKLRS